MFSGTSAQPEAAEVVSNVPLGHFQLSPNLIYQSYNCDVLDFDHAPDNFDASMLDSARTSAYRPLS